MAQEVFEGLRVVEFGDGMSCSLAAMIMGDYGAEVIKVEPKDGALSRSNPAFAMWARGKKSVVLDLDDGGDLGRAVKLARGADLVIADFGDGEAQRLGLDYDSLSRANEQIVCLDISGFGQVSRYEHLGMVDPIVTAKSGRSCNNHELSGSHVGGRAIHIAAPLASCGAAFLAVQGAVAALIARLRTGKGQLVETSLLDGLSAATMRLAFERDGDQIVPVESRGGFANLTIRCIRNCFIAPECKDGRYIQMCARQPKHFHNWLRALDLEHLLEDPRFAKAPLGLASFEDADELERLLRERMLTRTMDEWTEIFTTQYDVGADPFLLPDEFLQHPQMIQNERVIMLNDPEKGPVTQIGPLALFEKTPPQIDRPAPKLGADQEALDALLQPREGRRDLPAPGSEQDVDRCKGPLDGLTILELAYFLAAPLAATTLAELGARVIKIEPLAGDPFRTSGLEFVHIVAGKESIAIDLKNERGQEVFARLIRQCDGLLHNFRPGAPDRLKVDYATTSAINPRIVYLYGASYGSNGPEKHRPAFHSTPNALCGGGILQAGEGNVPIDESYPDPIAGLGAGVALAIGLYARERYDIGQYVETTMLTSSGFVHSEMLTRYDGAPPMPVMDTQQHGLHALYRLYRGSNDQYVFVAPRNDAEWRAMIDTIGKPELADDPRFADDASRKANDEALAETLATVFETREPAEWEHALNAAGVPVAAVFPSFERFLAEEDFLTQGEHSAFGSYWQLKPRIRLSRAATTVRAPSAIGEHSRALLAEAGFSDAGIDALIDEGVVRATESNHEPA